ncbi:MAG: efflux RND transporter permease subunit [Clostridia bacterium]|nr:efflux RND transporter permease subunit [Clostridia bacterium]
MKLYELSVKRPVAVCMAVLIFVVLGAYSLSMMKLELMPEMELSMAIVYTSYANVSSEEVENLITKPVESAISTVSGISTITSQSSEGTSMVLAQFGADVDMDKAIADMESALDLYGAMIPSDAEDPMVLKMDTTMLPSMMFSVGFEGYDPVQTKKFVEENLSNKLEAVAGVASVDVAGAKDRIIEVEIDPDKLFGYNMNVSSIAGSLAAQNLNLPAGATEQNGKDMSVRATGKFASVEEIGMVPLVSSTGQVMYLKDVATVRDTYADVSTYARLNKEDALAITITAESDANTVEVVESVVSVLETLKKQYPKFTYNITMEQASYITDAIDSVTSSAIIGGVLAVIILLLFLGNVRTSLSIGVSMPISIIVTFIAMFFADMSLNVVSLGGLALGVGMLVDNSVVLLENIFRRRKQLGENAETSAISGSREVVGAIIASVLTTCIVYVPILFIDNMMSEMFKQLAFAIIFSQAASLITAFMLLPMLSCKNKDGEKSNEKLAFILKPFEKFMDKAYASYEKALRGCLKRKKRVVVVTMCLFVAALVVIVSVGMSLMPESDEGSISVSISLPGGSQLEDTNRITLQAEDLILSHSDVETAFSSVGGASILGGGADSSSITVTLKEDRKKSTDDVEQELRLMLNGIPGATFELSSNGSGMNMSTNELSIQFTGSDEEALRAYVLAAQDIMAQVEGVTEVSNSYSETKTEAKIVIDTAKAARYGMNTSSVASAVKTTLDGMTAAKYAEGSSEYDIRIVYPDNYVKDFDAIVSIPVKTATGQWITLGDIATVAKSEGSATLTRVDQRRVVTVTAKLYGTDIGTAAAEFEEKLKLLPNPGNVAVEESGTYEIMMDAMKSLFTAILLGILLMYMVMAAQFESLLQPLLVLGTLPLALIGVALALLITGSSLSVVSCVGILMLIGIVVNNAILLIEFIHTTKEEHPEYSMDDRVVQAGKIRMRPILMTSFTSILGFMPMAFSTASGSEMMRPLAIVLVGGLFVSTLLTLLFIPVIYAGVEGRRERKKKLETEN